MISFTIKNRSSMTMTEINIDDNNKHFVIMITVIITNKY